VQTLLHIRFMCILCIATFCFCTIHVLLSRWDDAIRVADTSRHPQTEELKRAHYQWLLQTSQEDKAVSVCWQQSVACNPWDDQLMNSVVSQRHVLLISWRRFWAVQAAADT
jgi:hypothetical protein